MKGLLVDDDELYARTLQRSLAQPVFVDTAVLVAAEDGADAALQAPVLACLDLLWRERLGRVSSQGLALSPITI